LSAQIIGAAPKTDPRTGRETRGRSAVAAAAYRAGERLTNARTGATHDFSGKRGVVASMILAPEGTDPRLMQRETLWNAVETLELGKRRDAQLAREINLALPAELDDAGRLDLVTNFVRETFVAAEGMIADIAIHAPVAARGEDQRNHHAHVMLTLRKVDRATGQFFATKTRSWNSDAMLVAWRAAWARFQNDALARRGVRERVDHRSLVDQRDEARQQGDSARARVLDREPEIHEGARARAIVKAGRAPKSHSRVVTLAKQPRRAEGAEAPQPRRTRARRVVDYPAIDQGRSRTAANAERVARNLVRMERSLDRLQSRTARWRPQLAYFDERARLGGSPVFSTRPSTLFRVPRFAATRQRRLASVLKGHESLIAILLGLKTRTILRKQGLAALLGNGRILGRSGARPGGRPRSLFD
jgi:hypothetical protein